MSLSGNQGNRFATLRVRGFDDPESHRYPSLAEVIFQGAGGTLDSSEDESSEEEDVASMLNFLRLWSLGQVAHNNRTVETRLN